MLLVMPKDTRSYLHGSSSGLGAIDCTLQCRDSLALSVQSHKEVWVYRTSIGTNQLVQFVFFGARRAS